jgi:hypothetical protein
LHEPDAGSFVAQRGQRVERLGGGARDKRRSVSLPPPEATAAMPMTTKISTAARSPPAADKRRFLMVVDYGQ